MTKVEQTQTVQILTELRILNTKLYGDGNGFKGDIPEIKDGIARDAQHLDDHSYRIRTIEVQQSDCLKEQENQQKVGSIASKLPLDKKWFWVVVSVFLFAVVVSGGTDLIEKLVQLAT